VKGATFSVDGKESTELLMSNAERLIQMYTKKRTSILNPKQIMRNIKEAKGPMEAVKSFAESINPFLAISDFSEVVDRSYKIGFYKFLTNKGYTPTDAANYTKRLIGNPDPTYGGSGRVGIGVVLDFFNPTAQGNAKLLFLASKGTKNKTDVAVRTLRLMTNPLIVIGVMLPWFFKRVLNDDDDQSEFKQKRWMILSHNGMEFSLPKDNLMQLQHAMIWGALDTTYFAMKKQGDAAKRSFEDFVKTMIGASGLTVDNVNILGETLFELTMNKDSFTGQPVYSADASPDIRNTQIMSFIFNKFYGGVVPTKKTFGFVSGKSGVREKVTKNQELIEFKTAKANLAVMMEDLIRSEKTPSNKRLEDINKNFPELRGEVLKVVAMGKIKQEIYSKAKDNKALKDYAMNSLDLISRYGIRGNKELVKMIDKAKADPSLSPEDKQTIMKYIGIFGSN